MTVHIVTGNVRSGTSMMMRALITGGLTGKYRNGPGLTNMFHPPNPHGYFELEASDDFTEGFPDCHDGFLIKAFAVKLLQTPPGNVRRRAVYMIRPLKEILASFCVAFRQLPFWTNPHIESDPIKTIQNLTDLGYDVVPVHFHDVIADPLKEFERIKEFGWPIDPVKAAATVDPELYRIRLNKE